MLYIQFNYANYLQHFTSPEVSVYRLNREYLKEQAIFVKLLIILSTY
jgi:hypothetical protein